MPNATYVPLSTYTVTGSAVSTINFTSIPSDYTDLVVQGTIIPAGTTGSQTGTYLRFNGDSTSGLYSDTWFAGWGYSTSSQGTGSGRDSSQNQIHASYWNIGAVVPNPSLIVINIEGYSNTNIPKSLICRFGDANGNTANINEIGMSIGRWNNTNAITSISIAQQSFAANILGVGTSLTLYGIKAA